MCLPTQAQAVDVVIVGGGLCGVLAAHRCHTTDLTYCLIERQSDLGGVWASLANQHSHLQAFEAMYRWHKDYPLGSNPLAKISGPVVLRTIRRFAQDTGVYSNTILQSVVSSITYCDKKDRFIAKGQDNTGRPFVVQSIYIIITSGILGEQYSLQERGVAGEEAFKGLITFAGRSNGVDSAAGKADVMGKDVVIIGTGAFACEAMEACIRNGAKHVYLLSRERTRWVLPFSRQFTSTFVTYIPFLPWQWKMALLKAYLSRFYRKAGLLHMMPTCQSMDYTGQCNDAFFRLSKEKGITFVLDTPLALSERGVVCKSGKVLRADIIVNASGCKFMARPDFLQSLDLGYEKLYNHAFLGPSGRIGTASDFVFAFVPHGPKKQLDLIFHAIGCHQQGLSRELQQVLKHTPIATQEGAPPKKDTWFTTTHWYSTLNISMKERNDSYRRTMSVGVGPFGRVRLHISLAMQQAIFWLLSGCLAVVETVSVRII